MPAIARREGLGNRVPVGGDSLAGPSRLGCRSRKRCAMAKTEKSAEMSQNVWVICTVSGAVEPAPWWWGSSRLCNAVPAAPRQPQPQPGCA